MSLTRLSYKVHPDAYLLTIVLITVLNFNPDQAQDIIFYDDLANPNRGTCIEIKNAEAMTRKWMSPLFEATNSAQMLPWNLLPSFIQIFLFFGVPCRMKGPFLLVRSSNHCRNNNLIWIVIVI